MTAFDFITSLVDKLDDMVSKLRFHNLRDFLRISQVESHIGESRIEHTSTGIIQFTTLTG